MYNFGAAVPDNKYEKAIEGDTNTKAFKAFTEFLFARTTAGTIIGADVCTYGLFARFFRDIKKIAPWVNKTTRRQYSVSIQRFVNFTHNSNCLTVQMTSRSIKPKTKAVKPVKETVK